ncbi:MAG TPA: TadA family conjugal transfer-associated ATPase [Mycobacteriales bacterium]
MNEELLDQVRRRLAESGRPPSAAAVAEALRGVPGVRSDAETLAVVTQLRAEIVGAGPLQPLLDDPAVTDVLVHRGGEVWVDRGDGLRRSPVRVGGEAAVRRLAARLVASAGRRLDAAQPWADATLPDGHRCHAVLPPLAVDGTCLSLRTLRPATLDLAALDATGALPGGLRSWLEAILAAPLATLVTGATGAGKTTLLGALLGALAPDLRVLVVEDATELAPRHPHVVRLQSRPANVEGAGAVPLRDLVRQALRMRPDRLVLGEVRGAEVVDLLVALNTGHEGGLSTVHANSPAEVPARLEALGALAGLRRDALHSLVAAAVQAVVHCGRTTAGRQVHQVGVVDVVDRGVVVVPALVVARGALRPGPGHGSLCRLLAARGVSPPRLT